MRNMCGAACPRAEGDHVQIGPWGERRRREASTVAGLCRCPWDLGRQDLGPVCFSGVSRAHSLKLNLRLVLTGTDSGQSEPMLSIVEFSFYKSVLPIPLLFKTRNSLRVCTTSAASPAMEETREKRKKSQGFQDLPHAIPVTL